MTSQHTTVRELRKELLDRIGGLVTALWVTAPLKGAPEIPVIMKVYLETAF
jgi:hypothetical protein